MLSGKKVLITGGAGMMGRPVAETLARDNEVWVSSLFDATEQSVREDLEAQGIRTVAWDMAREGIEALPHGFTHVMHTAMLRDTDSYDDSVEVNSIAVARLMEHCRNAESFVFVSTMGVYKRRERDYAYVESDALGGDHSSMGPYVVGKIASEGVARALARLYNLPTTIVRPNVIYGPYGWGGVPILFLRRMIEGQPIEAPLDGENHCSLIHTDDITRFMPGFWKAASVPATVVNLGGDQVVTMPDYMGYVSELTGLPVEFVRSATTRDTYVSDATRRLSLVGPTEVDWRDGIRRTVEAHFPHLLKQPVA